MTMIQDTMIGTSTPTATPMIAISETAAARLVQMQQEKELSGFALRVFVQGGGCSGMQYGMTFDDEFRDGDTEFYAGELRVLVDPISAQHLMGATIDYIETVMNTGFKIDNPNAASSCGCGHSFRSKEESSSDEAEASSGGCGSCGTH